MTRIFFTLHSLSLCHPESAKGGRRILRLHFVQLQDDDSASAESSLLSFINQQDRDPVFDRILPPAGTADDLAVFELHITVAGRAGEDV